MYKIDKYRYLEYLRLQAFTTEQKIDSVVFNACLQLITCWGVGFLRMFAVFLFEKDVACVALLVHSYYSPHIYTRFVTMQISTDSVCLDRFSRAHEIYVVLK